MKKIPLIDIPGETVFYTMSVYFLAAKVTKTRYTLTRALLATLEIERINGINNPIERALEYFAYACKQQLFWDGNKRTSTKNKKVKIHKTDS